MDNHVSAAAPAPAPTQVQGDPNAARAEWDKLMADRRAGTTSDYEWNAASAVARRDALAATITGVPPNAQLSVQELSDSAKAHEMAPMQAMLEQHFAPPANASDYRPTYLDTPNEEAMAADSQLRESLHADRVPSALYATIDSDLIAAQRRQETPAQREIRMSAELERTTNMWGGDFEGNIAIIREALDKVSERSRAAFNTAWPYLSPSSRYQVLNWAKYRTGRSLL